MVIEDPKIGVLVYLSYFCLGFDTCNKLLDSWRLFLREKGLKGLFVVV